MNTFIKHIVETFDFNSVTKQKKTINVFDALIRQKLQENIDKILLGKGNELNIEDKKFLQSLPANSYMADNEEIYQLVKNYIQIFGNDCDLNWINVSNVTNMSNMFYKLGFNGDISKWDVSNVNDMYQMFAESKFNGDISNWDVSNVIVMQSMFGASDFNGDISSWDVSNVQDMIGMFANSKFNRNISSWKVNKVSELGRHAIFKNCPIRDEYKPHF